MKQYILTITEDTLDKKLDFNAMNTGFSALELIALLDVKKQDILRQFGNDVDFTRTFVHPDGTECHIEEAEGEN